MSKAKSKQVNLQKQFMLITNGLEMFSQAVLAINCYRLTDPNVIYDNIKECVKNSGYYNSTEMHATFSGENERYIRGILNEVIPENNAGFVFRLTENSRIICLAVSPEVDNTGLNQKTIYRYLAHECVHCAARLLECCGISLPRTLNDNEDEMLCLTTDFIFDKAGDLFDKAYFMKK